MLCWMQTVAGEKISCLCAVFCLYEKEHLEKLTTTINSPKISLELIFMKINVMCR